MPNHAQLVMLTTLPQPFSAIAGQQAWQSRNAAVELMFITRFHSCRSGGFRVRETACKQRAVQCHGLDPKFLSDKPPASFVIPSFVRWVDGAVLCGHNVAFDLRMLNGKP